MSEEYILKQCFHCGNKGLMTILCQHKHEFGGPILDQDGYGFGYELREDFEWTLLKCPICHMVSLLQVHREEENPGFDDEKILYPKNSINYIGVPSSVKSAFEAALKVKNIDTNICMLSLRRVLEAISKQQGAIGKDLNDMVNDLMAKGKLPAQLEDAYWLIRKLGNEAAHADNVSFYSYEVEQIIEFLEIIMKYLYILPAQMKMLKGRFTEKSPDEKSIF